MTRARFALARASLPAAFALLLFLPGCVQTYYDWGSYNQSIRDQYLRSEQYDLGADVARLKHEVEQTTRAGKRVPPGKYAHLGYLCYLAGDTKAAAGYFEAEKAAFPESAQFMDLMLARLK